MRRGDALIYSGRIFADDLLGIPDILRKDEQEQTLKKSYEHSFEQD
jgi:hypothetical protein